MEIGFVGLGAMGLPMCRHLLAAGHRLTVASRSPGPVERAVALGAHAGDGPAGVAAASDVLILCVPDSPDVAAVVDAALPALRPGAIVVDTSTIDPAVEIEQHAKVGAAGRRYLEAPLSGGTAGAEAGTLTLMVGGDAATLAAARPALEPFAGRIVHVGGPGAGQVVKLSNQLVFAAQMLAVAEAASMAAKAGIDLHAWHEVLTHSTGDCVALRTRVPFAGVVDASPASNGWRPGFMTDLMRKDVELALRLADRLAVPADAAAAVRPLLAAAQEAGFGREDFSALGKVVRARAGLGTEG